MHVMLPRLFALLIFVGALCAAQAPLIEYLPGGYFRRKPAPAFTDPVTPLSAEELTQVAKGRVKVDDLTESFVDRIEAHARESGALGAELDAFLAEHEDLRRAFWLAIDPAYDDLGGACAVLDRLRQEGPETVADYAHLAIAMAVVYDQPGAATSSRYAHIWAVNDKQWPDMPEWLDIWHHFTSRETGRLMRLDPDKLVWPLLVHVVDLDLTADERIWAAERYARTRDLAGSYHDVPYDYNKLRQKKPKLGSRPYTLENLDTYGGVCVDQSHYSSRIMKTFGLPAVKVAGQGRHGGAGHAWTGFLQTGRGLSFAFTGRYNNDYYYTGHLYDPQRQALTMDRSVARMLDGALKHYGKFIQARMLGRMAAGIMDDAPEIALTLVEEAIDLNPFAARPWHLLVDAYAAGALDDRDMAGYLSDLFKDLRDHPDLTFTILVRFMQHFDRDDTRMRQRLYHTAYQLYNRKPRTDDRPRADLQLALREMQMQELFEDGSPDEAATLALETIMGNAGEGALILGLVEALVNNCQGRPPKIRAKVYDMLDEMAESSFPKKRGDTITEPYQKLKAMIATLR